MDKNYLDYMVKSLEGIVKIDSPSGFCDNLSITLKEQLKSLGFDAKLSKKGALELEIKGKSDKKRVGIFAHIDTLGAMVKSISPSGQINFTRIGGAILPTLDGEYCRIYTRNNKTYQGTFLSTSPSVHVYKDSQTAPRDNDHMYIRLDEQVNTREDTLKLGIETGDYIAIEPNFCYTESGFIKSRFLDDKASASIIMTALKYISDNKLKPEFDTKVVFTVSEEIGHGGSPYGKDLDEVLAIDMGCIGLDLKCTEYDVSICALDSSGPYDYELTGRLIDLAKNNNLSYAVDVYPFYGSDASSMLRAGADIKTALIGAGIHASHGMERTHIKGLTNAYKLLLLYLNL